jgi:hypothetical protein
MGLEGFLDPATSSWLQFHYEAIGVATSNCPDSSTERLSSSQRQLHACPVVISHSFVLALVLVPRENVPGLLS